ncbi:hypothetical protein JCGZ_16391 [Jatropha curcas]|uniref:TIR domain-containing protein n=1 Tax=Jatropha curcas TaxID=180498 RepID=A0A067LBE5_JATCU|nr:hypothetical protein JCGZ_16391 [Jatropha curcas]
MDSSSTSPLKKLEKQYDVFVNFRGEDVWDVFLSHLHKALSQNEMVAFVDEKLDRGEDISSSLLAIIDKSYISVVIFSENYAYSPWCLDELVKILDCNKTMEQMVLPVFYRVDPSHVQNLTGKFGDAIAKHREEPEYLHKGTEAIKGISLNMSTAKELNLKPRAFAKMYNLKFLKFYASLSKIKVYLPKGLSFLPEELRLIHWYQFPLKSLPLGSYVENLVELRMHESKLKELCSGVQQLGNLKFVDLSHSKELIRISDLSRACKLEVLDLNYCESLVEFPSPKYLSKLTRLHLMNCNSLCTLPTLLDLKSLKEFRASECLKLAEFPEFPCNIEVLVLERTTVHPSIGSLSRLSSLYLSDSTMLESLPDSICNLKSLMYFYLGGCVNLKRLPENIGNLESLTQLDLGGTCIKGLPSSVNLLRQLRYIRLESCGLSEFPSCLCHSDSSLEWLLRGGNNFESIPDCSKQLSKLRFLSFRQCFIKITAIFLVQNIFYPGNELPQRMMYQNNCGYSPTLSSSSKQHERVQFGLCVVIDPKFLDPVWHVVSRIGYTVYIFTNETVKELDNKKTVFEFYALDRKDRRNYNAIVKCGVHPHLSFSNVISEEDEVEDEENRKMKRRLRKRKVLIVLDDVNDERQITQLIGQCNWYGAGSRIILTSRERKLLRSACRGEFINEVKNLTDDEALQLISRMGL